MTISTNRPSFMESRDAELVQAFAREIEARAEGRSSEVAHFAAWVRTRLDIIAEQLTSSHRSRSGVAKASRRTGPSLN